MPLCRFGTQVYEVNSCDECQGQCPAGPPDGGGGDGGGGKGGCFIKTIIMPALGETMLALGMTYQLEWDFVNNVLGKSAIGKHLVKMMIRYRPVALRLMVANTELLGQAIRTWLIITPFVQAVETCASNGGATGKEAGYRYTRALHSRFVRLLHAFHDFASNKEFKKFLDDVEAELAHYVGQTPEEVLKTLNRGGTGAPRSTKRRR